MVLGLLAHKEGSPRAPRGLAERADSGDDGYAAHGYTAYMVRRLTADLRQEGLGQERETFRVEDYRLHVDEEVRNLARC